MILRTIKLMFLSSLFFSISLVCFGEDLKVVKIIDGDTFIIETGEKVRLIGINAPEISDIFGQEAKSHLQGLIEGKIINLEKDPLTDNRDIYSRLLRFVILDGVDINKRMISDGYAFAYLKYKFSKKEEYRKIQIASTEANLGIWGNHKIQANIDLGVVEKKGFSFNFIKYGIIVVLLSTLVLLGIYFTFKKP